MKVEGFFALCKERGFTGTQGVIIPGTNVRHLMLKPEIVDAVDRGEFNVWAVNTVDEGIELLTGVAAGERRPDGSYPAESVHGRVAHKLRDLSEQLASYGQRHRNGRRRGLASANSAKNGQSATG